MSLKESEKRWYHRDFVVALLAALLAILIVAFIFWILWVFVFDVNNLLLDDGSCVEKNGGISCFIKTDKTWDANEYLGIVSGFYSTIITLLIAILAIFSFVGLFVIRNSYRSMIEDAVERELPNYFEKKTNEEKLKDAVYDVVERRIGKRIEALEAENQKIQGILEENYDLPADGTIEADD